MTLPLGRRRTIFFVLLLIWGATYLTFLGSSELRSEEGHRVLPAVQMLDSGNYVVPYVGSEPYLQKPPLINWIVAASFKLFGVCNDWTARLPSPLFLLASALLLFFFARPVLGPAGSSLAALCWLTNLGLIEKGRMIEIEALYVTLFAFACILWLVWWQEHRTPWVTLTIPWIFLGLGLLTKGPAHILFFYVLVGAVLWRTKRLRDLLHPAHLAGILLMLAIFASWAIPYFRALHWSSPLQAWGHDAAAAIHGEEGRMENWSLNFPRGLAYFLPWVLLAPFLRLNRIADWKEREATRGLIWGSIVLFVVILLIPGTLPRYVLPLMAPFCYILGIAIKNDAFSWRIDLGPVRTAVPPLILSVFIAIGVVAAMIIFPLRSITFLKRHERIKPVAAQINKLVPPDERIYAINPPYQPYLFYVRARLIYLRNLSELPADARFLLVPPHYQSEIANAPRWAHSPPKLVAQTSPYRKADTVLFAIEPQ